MRLLRHCSFRHGVRGRRGQRRRLGVLAVGERLPTMGPNDTALRDGLRNHGWIDGRTLIIEWRYAQSQDHVPAVEPRSWSLSSPDLLVAIEPTNSRTPEIGNRYHSDCIRGCGRSRRDGPCPKPIASRRQHNGSCDCGTGLRQQTDTNTMEIVPTASKVAVLANPGNPMYRLVTAEELPQTAQKLGVALPIVDATTAEELDIAFASAAAQHADAIIVFGDPLTSRYATQVTALAAKHRLPAMYLSRIFVTNGGLFSYAPDFSDLYFRAGGYVDKILKGAKPSDLPVEQPTRFQLAINMKTAKALDLTVPPSLLFRADEVIE